MEKKLQFKDYMYVGSMLFGLFFGAGNLIFPVHMGQEAGANVGLANLGFFSDRNRLAIFRSNRHWGIPK